MEKCFIPENYKQKLDGYETQRAIEFIKHGFQKNLRTALNLKRVSAPLFVRADTGLNDNLSGKERPVTFDVPSIDGAEMQVVHSLAKWKRWALKQYDFHPGKGLYTDMNAIRRDEDVLDNIHSVYVDQWDWEKVITKEERTIAYLKETVNRIVSAICVTAEELHWEFEELQPQVRREVTFITTQELEDLYPDLTPGERENVFVKEHKTVFLMQIGKTLRSGNKHDGRAPDYDDWELNGDLLVWNDVLQRSFELSSMGIRVDEESMKKQLALANCEDRAVLPFHKALLSGELPLTIGGGIGQSRLCMLLMGSAHIGEVQSSIWDEETLQKCKDAGIRLL